MGKNLKAHSDKRREMSPEKLTAMLVTLAEATPTQNLATKEWASKLKTYLETLRFWDEETLATGIKAGLKTWKWFPSVAEIHGECLKVVREARWWADRRTANLQIAERKEREELSPEQRAENIKPLTDFLESARQDKKRAFGADIETRGRRGSKTMEELDAKLVANGQTELRWF